MKTKIHVMSKMFIVALLAVSAFSLPAVADDSTEQNVRQAMDRLASEAREARAAVADALGHDFEEQLAEAMENLEEDPTSLDRQLQVADVLIAHVQRLQETLVEVRESNLLELRDRVINGLTLLAQQKANERDSYLSRAQSTEDPELKARYESLAQAAERLHLAYMARIARYESYDLATTIRRAQATSEYLACVEQMLQSLRSGLAAILSDDEALVELQNFVVTVEGIQEAVEEFSLEVFNSEVFPDEDVEA